MIDPTTQPPPRAAALSTTTPCPLCNAWRKQIWSRRPTTPVPPRAAQELLVIGYWIRHNEQDARLRFCEQHGTLLEKLIETEAEEKRQLALAKEQEQAEEERRKNAAKIAAEAAANAVAKAVVRAAEVPRVGEGKPAADEAPDGEPPPPKAAAARGRG